MTRPVGDGSGRPIERRKEGNERDGGGERGIKREKEERKRECERGRCMRLREGGQGGAVVGCMRKEGDALWRWCCGVER